MISKKDHHIHEFKKLGYVKEFGTGAATGNRLVPNPPVKTIRRIILTRSCKCGVSQAFECGDKDKMRDLYATLRG